VALRCGSDTSVSSVGGVWSVRRPARVLRALLPAQLALGKDQRRPMHKPHAPIALFAYRRLDHTRRTIEALLANAEAATSDLIIFADAASTAGVERQVAAVRRYLRGVSGFGSVTLIEREQNCGLANSIIAGVTQVLR